MTSSYPNPSQPSPQPPMASETTVALVIYILYFVAYITGITALVGVIMAHVKLGMADPLLATHYRFQIRTFWIGLLYLVIGWLLIFILIGFLVWLWWFVWSLIRNVKGVLALNEHRPIENPTSWMFG